MTKPRLFAALALAITYVLLRLLLPSANDALMYLYMLTLTALIAYAAWLVVKARRQ